MQLLLALGAVAGFSGVAFGAFGGHGLRKKLADAPEGAKRLEWWQTGSSYHLAHAVAIAVAALVAERVPGASASAAAWAFLAGIVLFSGSLYAMALTGVRKLGAITPLGGLGLLAGWACLLAAALAG
ncbi:MAG TPA: DUF423 domain-containing protein [Polyangiaceae bacterium]|nr:DUF423 domain-containing protein [Polyangiaceae bacterium]